MRLAIPGLMIAALSLLTLTSPTRAQESANVSALENPEIPLLEWRFSPGDVTVTAGGTVTWTSEGLLEHTVSSATGVFDGSVSRGNPYSRTFSTPGVFPYFCDPHPWMQGTVTVLAAAAPQEAPAEELPMDEVETEK